jgi:phage shock protein E
MFNDILNVFRGNKTAINNISGEEFQRLMREEDNALILDVRTPGEFAMGRIPGARNIDISGRDFSAAVDALDRDATVLLYCRSGSRSYHAGAMMARMGFGKVYNLAEGLFDWDAELVR